MSKTIIAPSILAADFAQLGAECQRVLDGGADTLHVDVMDGHFVPNISLGPGIVKALRTHLPNAFLDCHLMVSDPLFWVEEFGKSGASQFTFHIEAVDNNTAKAFEVINKIKQHNMKVGVAVKPRSSVELLFPFGEVADLLLVMTVEPGFGGQRFMADMIPKVATLRSKFPNANIQVDGGLI